MNILITSHRFFPDIGGIETLSMQLAKYFSRCGHKVRIVTNSSSSAQCDLEQLPFLLYRQPSLIELFRCFLWADVVLQINLELRCLWPNLLVRKPLVIGLQTWIRNSAGKRDCLQRLKVFTLRVADIVIACSAPIRDDSFSLATIIPNPYRSQEFCLIGSSPRQTSVVYLGRLVSDKGVDILIRAFSALNRPQWTLTIIGSGPHLDSLLALANELNTSHSVFFKGSLCGPELVAELNRHEIMVVPSSWPEPFGIVALEGMACGCVVVGSDSGGLPDAIGDAGVLFTRGSPTDLSKKLSALIDNPSLREDYRRLAIDHLTTFKEATIGDKYIEILHRLYISRARRARSTRTKLFF